MDAQASVSSEPLIGTELRERIAAYFPRYPTRQAVLLPALHLVQERLGYIPQQAIIELAQLLGLQPAEVADVVSFYSFFKQDRPLGKYRIWVCRSISCTCRDGENLLNYLVEKLGVQPGQTTEDGLFTLEAAECLGVCDFAPAILVNDRLYGNMTQEKVDEMIIELRREAQNRA